MKGRIYIWIIILVGFLFGINKKEPYIYFDKITDTYVMSEKSKEVLKKHELLQYVFTDESFISKDDGLKDDLDPMYKNYYCRYFTLNNLNPKVTDVWDATQDHNLYKTINISFEKEEKLFTSLSAKFYTKDFKSIIVKFENLSSSSKNVVLIFNRVK